MEERKVFFQSCFAVNVLDNLSDESRNQAKHTKNRQNTQLMDKTKSYKGISQVMHKIVRQILHICKIKHASTRKEYRDGNL